MFAPVRNGPLAIAQILAPYLFLAVFLTAPLGFLSVGDDRQRRARRLLRVGLLACAVLALVRFGPSWVSFPPTVAAGTTQIGVTSWNLELGEADPAVVVEALRHAEPGLVGLEELTTRHASAIAADPEIRARFPYQALDPMGGSLGIGLLSTHPIVEVTSSGTDPPLLAARVDLGSGRVLSVLVAHPPAAEIQTVTPLDIPIDYDAERRDQALLEVRAEADPVLASGVPFVLLGDFNVTDREPGYVDLRDGPAGSQPMLDAYQEVGLGPGSTWRPPAIQWLPFGLLRIDMVFTANGVVPTRIASDCTPRGSDHCILQAGIAVP